MKAPEASPNPEITLSRIYTLKEAFSEFNIRPGALLDAAAGGSIGLCVKVPPGRRAHHLVVEAITGEADFSPEDQLLYGDVDHSIETKAHPRPCGLGTIALAVSPYSCTLALEYGYARQSLFHLAYQMPAPLAARPMPPLRAMQPFQELFLEDDFKEISIPNSVFGLYANVANTLYADAGRYPPPEEQELSVETLCILGDELSRFLAYSNTIGKPTSKKEGKRKEKSFPPAIADFFIPNNAPSALKILYEIAISEWSTFKLFGDFKESDKRHASVVTKIEALCTSGEIDLPVVLAKQLAAIIRPIWARGELSEEFRDSRGMAFVTPEMEKMVIVHNEIIAASREVSHAQTSTRRREKTPKKKKLSADDVADLLADNRHYSVSRRWHAPVAARLMRLDTSPRRRRAPSRTKRKPNSAGPR